MDDLCERTRKLIHKELRSQYLDTLTYKNITLAGICIKHAPPNCFLSQQILKKLMNHYVLYKCEQVQQNLLVNYLEKNYCNVFMQKQLTVFSSIDGLELRRASRNEFEKQMVLQHNSIQCGRTAEYLLGPNSASSVVMLSRCCYMDLRQGKK